MKDCEEWDGYKTSAGYGSIYREGKQWLAHRWVWTKAHGPIPEGMVIRHKCDNPPCARLDHLELGTMADNSRDMVERSRNNPHQSAKTQCPQGHAYTEENTYVPPNRKERQCRTCSREKARERYRAKHGVTKFRVPGETVCP